MGDGRRHRHGHRNLDATRRDALFWHDFLLRDAALPHELSAKIRGPDGPLRWLLLLDPPPFVVRAILDDHGREVRSAAARAGNRRGETALHQACEEGCCGTVVEMIAEENLAAAQRRDSVGRLPLHCVWRNAAAATAVMRAHPKAAAARDGSGSTPLHHAVRFGSVEVVRVMVLGAEEKLGLERGGALAENARGETPLSLACESFRLNLGKVSQSQADEEWEKLEALVIASLPHDKGKPFRVLHAVLQLGCPSMAVLEALRRCPGQTSERDEKGRTPLHIACTRKKGEVHKGYHLAAPEVIGALLDSNSEGGYPDAARCLDNDGRLPLHLAAESGMEVDGALEIIFQAAPRALETRDMQTHMYPFAMAAAGGISSLSSVYWLLRMAPMLLMQSFQNPSANG